MGFAVETVLKDEVHQELWSAPVDHNQIIPTPPSLHFCPCIFTGLSNTCSSQHTAEEEGEPEERAGERAEPVPPNTGKLLDWFKQTNIKSNHT